MRFRRFETRFGAAIISVGVIVVWMWCLAAALMLLQMFLEKPSDHRLTELLAAVAITAILFSIAFGYPRYVARHYRRLSGRDPWFLYPLRPARKGATRRSSDRWSTPDVRDQVD